ncbi:MAG: AlkA N-terminal domain-containing protein [Jatrophihabitans sp.]
MLPDDDICYRAVSSRDPRFDGFFYTGVTSTGIYCRPSCPAMTPRRANVRFFASAAGAQRDGFRACKRCRPDVAAGSPEWDIRGDLAGRALRMTGDGVVDREGVPGLARRLGYSERQLGRTLLAEVGAGPLALARSHRAQTARILLETTDLPASDIAFAAGFASIRQFNQTMREVYASSPRELRQNRRGGPPAEGGTIELRLPFRAPLGADQLLGFLAAHGVAGIEHGDETSYTRTMRLPFGAALATLTPQRDHVAATLRLTDHRDLTAAVSRIRRLLDLDADPAAVEGVLADVAPLRKLVRSRPGLRSPGATDGFELAFRTIVGQQVSVAGARTVLARIVAEHGERVLDGWSLFPAPESVAELDPQKLPLPRARGRALIALARAVADGLALDSGADRDDASGALLQLPGVGPWTVRYVRMRALADPDVLLDTDLAVRRMLTELGITQKHTDRSAPWRSYVSHHLWAEFVGRKSAIAKPRWAT